MANDNYDQKYTRPDLRRRLKEEIKEGDKGGRPGQWSARKSQLLVQEYEKQGGGYKKDKKDKASRSLEQWTKQDWQTRSGSARAKKGERMQRYLPQQAWALLQDKDRKKAERTKKKADDQGEQVAGWPKIVQQVMVEIGAVKGGQGLSKAYLTDRAEELGIEDGSGRSKEELKEAIFKAYKTAGAGSSSEKTKKELYEAARERNIKGRSKMSKEELAKAIEKAG